MKHFATVGVSDFWLVSDAFGGGAGGFAGCGKTILARMAEQRAEGSR